MKLKNIVFTALIAVLTVACNQTEFDAMELRQLSDAERWTTTHTIRQLINEFSVGETDYPTRPNTGNLFRVDTIRSGGDPIVISGRVISSDDEGNIYKYIIIQEEATGMALKISIDAGSLSGIMPVGQLIHVKCNGLVIGKYADMYQLGVLYKNERKKGYEPGRIPYVFFKQNIQLDGVPKPDKIVITEMTIKQILDSDNTVHSKLVKIKDAYFTGRGADRGTPATIPDREKIFAPSTNGVGYPQSREIQDETGSIFVSTSEYARFAKNRIPEPAIKGEITAIVGWYNDKDTTKNENKIYHQLVLRSLQDLGTGFEAYHAANK